MNIKKVVLAVIISSSSPLTFGNAGGNALIQPSKYGHADVVQILLANGADASIINNDGNKVCDNAHGKKVKKLLSCSWWKRLF